MVAEGFPCDGVVTEERVRLLLAQQSESPSLDYKSECHITTTKGKLEFVKDCAAMMSRPEGGYLVIGADGIGKPTGVSMKAADFDESRLRTLLEKHLGLGINIKSQTHNINGDDITVVFIGRRDDRLFPVVKADAGYAESGGKTTLVLRQGDVFVRRGTSSDRWQTADLAGLLEPYVEAIRQEERDRVGELVERITDTARGATIARGPLGGFTWKLSDLDFRNTLTEAIRNDDTVVIQTGLLEMRNDLVQTGSQTIAEPSDDLTRILDRIASALAIGVMFEHEKTIELALDAMLVGYRAQAMPEGGSPARAGSAVVWLEIAKRVLGVLALCVRMQRWAEFRRISLQGIGTSYLLNWIRHASVWAHRGDIMPKGPSGQGVPGALIALTRHAVQALPALRIDVPQAEDPAPIGSPPSERDPLLDSICQADYLACVLDVVDGQGNYFPSFSGLFPHRVHPLIAKLESDASVRGVLLPQLSQSEWLETMKKVEKLAGRQEPYLW